MGRPWDTARAWRLANANSTPTAGLRSHPMARQHRLRASVPRKAEMLNHPGRDRRCRGRRRASRAVDKHGWSRLIIG